MVNGIVNSSQQIVTSGLLINYDAAQLRSYPTTGTNVTDLSGNNTNGTLVNGVAFDTSNGGTFSFDGTNDYIEADLNVSGTTSKSINMWIYPKSTTQRGICGVRPPSAQSGWAIRINQSINTVTYYHTGGNTVVSTAIININNWHNICLVYNSSPTSATWYINGVVNNTVSPFAAATAASAGTGRIGIEGTFALGYFNGYIQQYQQYNRVLTAAEILQNFNANRSRYGL